MDEKTKLVVKAFQTTVGLYPDGLIGPLTLRAASKVMEITAVEDLIELFKNAGPLIRTGTMDLPVVVSSDHKYRNPGRPNHNGIDVVHVLTPGAPAIRNGDGGAVSVGKKGKRLGVYTDRNHDDGLVTLALAPCSGEVAEVKDTKTGGLVWVRVTATAFIGYMHLRRMYVRVGEQVKVGSAIGEVGDNPAADDIAHLHFEVYVSPDGSLPSASYPGGTVDPQKVMRGLRSAYDA